MAITPGIMVSGKLAGFLIGASLAFTAVGNTLVSVVTGAAGAICLSIMIWSMVNNFRKLSNN